MKQTIHVRWQTVLRKAGLVLPFIALAVLSAVLFPRYTTSFRYHCEVGKPWAYDLVTAEFDFPIYKTDAEILQEQQEAICMDRISHYDLQRYNKKTKYANRCNA